MTSLASNQPRKVVIAAKRLDFSRILDGLNPEQRRAAMQTRGPVSILAGAGAGSGKEPGRDIEIVYSGVRPGEKLTEELWGEHEMVSPTEHPKIRKLTCPAIDPKWLESELAALSKLVDAGDADGVVKRLAKATHSAERLQGVDTTKTVAAQGEIDAVSEQPVG